MQRHIHGYDISSCTNLQAAAVKCSGSSGGKNLARDQNDGKISKSVDFRFLKILMKSEIQNSNSKVKCKK
jgi:hypothetical protein